MNQNSQRLTFFSRLYRQLALSFWLQEIARTSKDPVKTKVLELVQTWSHAFREEAAFKVVNYPTNLPQ